MQACEENPAEAIAAELRFLQAQKVYCSPLTRAVQTALITTQTLLSKEIPLHLMPEAREIKKVIYRVAMLLFSLVVILGVLLAVPPTI